MKRIVSVIAAILLLLSMLVFTGCEPVLDSYESNTFELGESGKPWYDNIA